MPRASANVYATSYAAAQAEGACGLGWLQRQDLIAAEKRGEDEMSAVAGLAAAGWTRHHVCDTLWGLTRSDRNWVVEGLHWSMMR
jgi:hypothetical protein